jgi:hypothetical protein
MSNLLLACELGFDCWQVAACVVQAHQLRAGILYVNQCMTGVAAPGYCKNGSQGPFLIVFCTV